PAATTYQNAGMQYQVPAEPVNPPTIVLQRLACPNLPEQSNPGLNNPLQPYNPYVTVDFMKNIPVNDGTGGPSGTSSGRDNPYRAQVPQPHAPPTPPRNPPPPPPINTFSSVNSQVTATTAFKWMIHLDRPLRSPMELMHVSAFKPGELTQMFGQRINSTNAR